VNPLSAHAVDHPKVDFFTEATFFGRNIVFFEQQFDGEGVDIIVIVVGEPFET
jgi:hypothetical protein